MNEHQQRIRILMNVRNFIWTMSGVQYFVVCDEYFGSLNWPVWQILIPFYTIIIAFVYGVERMVFIARKNKQ